MASLAAIHAVTSGLAQYLTRAHQLSPIRTTSCAFTAVGTGDFKKLDGQDTTCSLFLHRVSLNEHVRNDVGRSDPRRPALSLNLHMLVTVWADSAQKEQLVFAWVMRELTRLAVLDGSVLGSSAGLEPGELIQLGIDELSTDDLSKIWQMLAPPYRLSASFVARNVRIGDDGDEAFAPVVARRVAFTSEGDGT